MRQFLPVLDRRQGVHLGSLDHRVDRGQDDILVDSVASEPILGLVGELDMLHVLRLDRVIRIITSSSITHNLGNPLQCLDGEITARLKNHQGGIAFFAVDHIVAATAVDIVITTGAGDGF